MVIPFLSLYLYFMCYHTTFSNIILQFQSLAVKLEIKNVIKCKLACQILGNILMQSLNLIKSEITAKKNLCRVLCLEVALFLGPLGCC